MLISQVERWGAAKYQPQSDYCTEVLGPAGKGRPKVHLKVAPFSPVVPDDQVR